MARNKANQQNIDGSDLFNYPDKRIRNNDGSGNGTPVDESVYGDIHETFGKAMRDSKTNYNGLPDNTTNGYQFLDALLSLAGKNDLVKNLNQVDQNTLSIPIKIGALKQDEAVIFKAMIESTNQFQTIRGSDNISKPVTILGGFQIGQKVRMINDQNSISLVGLYDSELVPNLATTLQNIITTFDTWSQIMAVWQEDGGMIFWNKPANLIPPGWAEVVDWRGRLPIGVDPGDIDFQVIGKEGGKKHHNLTLNQMPKHSHNFQSNRERVGNGNQNAVGAQGGNQYSATTSESGNGEAFPLMNPYRTVYFIEYVG